MKIKDQFEIARKAWPGDKNGIDPEWATFLKVCKKHKLEPAKTVPLLLPAIVRYKAYCSARRDRSEWVETCAHFQTWLNDRRWLKEHPTTRVYSNPPCRYCGKPSIATYINNPHCESGVCRAKAQE